MTDQTGSELHKPLGVSEERAVARRLPPWLDRAGIGLVGAIWLVILGYAMIVDNPMGGEPTAISAIRPRDPAAAAQAEKASPAKAQENADGKSVATATEVEASSGVTVVRPGAGAPNSVIIRIPGSEAAKLAPAPDPRLVERSRHGLLPKMASDGARPFDVYARPTKPPASKPKGRIALLVGGLGISQTATADAIARLPEPVSLAFAPYGAELERAVGRARAQGHEVFLQIPMEPFDYPDNDPGPHTLLTSVKPAENIERLHWAMARFAGYVGVVNFTGGRFTASEPALAPVLRELADRGLMIVDDGSSARSLLAASVGDRSPALKADLVLDATPRPEAIDQQLARLEELARQKGAASASASALPVTVERIQRWSRELEAKGLLLVPVSSLATGRQGATTGSLR